MLRVSAFEVFLDLWVAGFPEALEVFGHLDRAVIGREDFDDHLDGAICDRRGLVNIIEMLQQGRADGFGTALVTHAQTVAVAQSDSLGNECVKRGLLRRRQPFLQDGPGRSILYFLLSVTSQAHLLNDELTIGIIEGRNF